MAPPWFKQLRAAVIGIMMSGKTFSTGAEEYATREAVVTKDVEQMVEDLVRSPWLTAGMRGAADNIEFDRQMFVDHLKKINTHGDGST